MKSTTMSLVKTKLKNIRTQWNKSLGFRLSFFIISVTILLFIATLLTCLLVAERVMTSKIIEKTNGQMADAIEVINLSLRNIEETTKDYALFAQYCTKTKDGAYEMCEKLLDNNPEIFAATVMYRPDFFKNLPAGHHLYAPYVTRKDGSSEYIRTNLTEKSDSSYLYTLTNGIWSKTIESKDGYWVEPYNDVLFSKEFLESFSYPIRDEKGEVYALLCVDIKLKWLNQRTNSLKPTRRTNFAITTSQGNFLVHHIPEFIGAQDRTKMNRHIDSLYKKGKINSKWLEINSQLRRGGQGVAQIKHTTYFSMLGKTDTVKPGFIIFAPIKETGWTISAICPKSDIREQTENLLHKVLLCSVIGLVIMIAALYYMVRKMIRPYKKFAAVDADLKTAAGIQRAMIPKAFPKSEDMNGAEIFASMKPAKDVGGDLYDYVFDGDSLTFIIGDVSGKGVPASLFMAGAIMLFRTFAKHDNTPGDILTHINDNLSENNELNMFVTMFICKMNIHTGHIDFCNGGHNAPVLIHDGKAEFIKTDTNLPIGVMEGMAYKQDSIELKRGEKLLLYTDGVTEAENTKGKLYSDDHLLEFLESKEYPTVQELCNGLSADISKHAGNAEQSDDITMICIKY